MPAGIVSNSAEVASAGNEGGNLIIRMPNRSRTVVRYSTRFKRRNTVPPGSEVRSADSKSSFRRRTNASTSSAVGCRLAVRGGMSPSAT